MLKQKIPIFRDGFLNSYSQVFFSNHKVLAWILVTISFFDFFAGLCGFFGVIGTNLLSYWLGFDERTMAKGLYGFNMLLVGLGMGIYFEPSFHLCLLLILAIILTFFMSIVLQGVLGKYGLSYLGIPFLASIWILMLAATHFEALGMSYRGIYTLNDLYIVGGSRLVRMYEWWNTLTSIGSLKTYFISLGAIFFQYNVLSGILISLGLLIFSRIAFTLSLLGFYTAYFFYKFIGAELTALNYSYIGFNYILTAIALGGFFLVPSRLSYFWTVAIIPLVVILSTSLTQLLNVLSLPLYSLPFNMVVLIFIYVLKLRIKKSPELTEVIVQQYAPEKNLYAFLNHSFRFKDNWQFPIHLPFWGEWSVQQAHDGLYTHKDEWRHAWDFVITDGQGKTFRDAGMSVKNYYCYNKTVVAPAAGIIETVVDGIRDNEINDVNLVENWGNTIIIKHVDFLYSKLCHLKPGSIKIQAGDYVKKGQVLAACGNSGRSPEPHLHFQLQATPYIGSKTLDYPLCHYIQMNDQLPELKSFARPEQDHKITNLELHPLIENAFHFIPGKHLAYKVEVTGQKNQNPDLTPYQHLVGEQQLEVQTDIYNNTFLKCLNSNSIAYLENDGNLHYFKHYDGNRKGFLFYFFIALYKVQLGYYQGLNITDAYPINLMFKGLPLFFQDFIAPFYVFLKSHYSLIYHKIDDVMSPNEIILKGTAQTWIFKNVNKIIHFNIKIGKAGIECLEIDDNGIKIKGILIEV